MSKRILSLALVLCMLVLAVPVFALPTLAAANPTVNFYIGQDSYDRTTAPIEGTENVLASYENQGTLIKSTTWRKLRGIPPTDEDLAGTGYTAADILTWAYWDLSTNTYRNIADFISGSADIPAGATSLDFYPVFKDASLAGQGNSPYFTTSRIEDAAGAFVALDTTNGTFNHSASTLQGYRGGFTFIEWTRASNTVYNYFSKLDANTFTAHFDGQWAYGGIFLGNDRENNNSLIACSSDQWLSAFDYHAMADGKITVTVPKLATATAGIKYIVIQNDTVILGGAATGTAISSTTAQASANWGTFGLTGDSGYEALTDASVQVDVAKGDIIRIAVCGAGENIELGTFDPSVRYDEVYASYLLSSSSTANRPTPVGGTVDASGSDPIVYTGGWDYVAYSGKDLTGATVLSKRIAASGTMAFVSGTATGLGSPGYVFATGATETDYWPGYGFGLYRGNILSTRYTAPESGKIDIEIDRIMQSAVGDADHKLTIEYAIYVAGKQVWPTTGDWYSITYYHGTIAEGAKTETNQGTLGANMVGNLNDAIPKEIAVKEGDTVDFLVRGAAYQTCDPTTGEVTNASAYWNFYDARGSYFEGSIGYTEFDTLVTGKTHTSKLSNNMPTNDPSKLAASGAEDVVYPGAWKYISYANKANALGMKDVDVLVTHAKSAAGQSWLVSKDGVGTPTGTNHAYVYWNSTSRPAAPGYWCGAGMGFRVPGAVVGTRYTAEYNGYVDLSVETLGLWSTVNAPITTSYAILVDGEQVWPVDNTGAATEDWYSLVYGDTAEVGTNYASTINDTIPKNIFVKAGQAIDFVVLGGPEIVGGWDSRGNYFDGVVTYNKIIEAPSVQATATFGDKLGLSFSIGGTANAGFTVDGEEVDSIELTPVEANKEFVVRSYLNVDVNGSTVKINGAAKRVSFNSVMKAHLYGANADAAQSVLNYTAAYDAYFGGGDINEVPARFTGEYNTNAIAATYTGANKVAINGLSLIVTDTVGIKLVADKLPAGAKVQVASDVAFENILNAGNDTASATKDGKGSKYTMKGIALSEWNTMYYFRIVDASGNAISDTVQYSVSTYCARMKHTEDVKLSALINSMMVMYEALNPSV